MNQSSGVLEQRFVLIPVDHWEEFCQRQLDMMTMIHKLEEQLKNQSAVSIDYIPALQYMDAVGIKRSKFDDLVAGNKIKTIKKKRKIYVHVREIERYFTDSSIQ